MRLYPKWMVSDASALRFSGDAWMVFPNGVHSIQYLVDLRGARRIFNVTFMYWLYVNGLFLILLVLFVDPPAVSTAGLLLLCFLVLSLHIVGDAFRRALLTRLCSQHPPVALPEDWPRRWRKRKEGAVIASSHGTVWALAVLVVCVLTAAGSIPATIALPWLTMLLMGLQRRDPAEPRPAGGWRREGLEELWASPTR